MSAPENAKMGEMIERVARALAKRHGDNWDDLPNNKGHWIRERGQFNGRFRDVNERFRCDYLDEAQAAIEAMREPTQEMIDACDINIPTEGTITGIWDDMISAALK
jgi:hypothetical protein